MSTSRFELKDKIDKYFYWLTNYGHEAASVWVQGNVPEDEIEDFKREIKRGFAKHGFKS
jgi:hypothetical protein